MDRSRKMIVARAPIVVREVWQNNLNYEFSLITQSLNQFSYVSFDTEFPGTVYTLSEIPEHKLSTLTLSQRYFIMKCNVDVLNIIQLGITLFDTHGNIPQFGTQSRYVWQFNFRDFDLNTDRHNPKSIALLKRQGMDFSKNKLHGVDSRSFAMLYNTSVLGRNSPCQTCVTFHNLYDFGFLIKILTRRQLPDNLDFFIALVEVYFGKIVYDLKPMTREFGLHGGLQKIADSLNLRREVGRSHQAGSDSLLIMQVFMKLKRKNCLATSS